MTKTKKTIAGLVLTACYFAGLVCMFCRAMGIGLILWVVGTVGGMGYLYWLKQDKERREAEAKENPPA